MPPHGRIEDDRNPVNAQGIYLADRFGNLDLLHYDAEISSMTPLPVRSRPRPPVYSSVVERSGEQVGTVVLQDIYRGLTGIERGAVKRLRIVGVVPKVQPRMNVPSLGVSREETGKFVLGSVPVERDGSAHFRIPSGVPVFFQALDESDRAVQTMRSLTYVQPGQTMSCVGCHESRHSTPIDQLALAQHRSASRIRRGPSGTWPLRYDQLVQEVLDDACLQCHRKDGSDTNAAAFDLTSGSSRAALLAYAGGDLSDLVFERDMSIAGETPSLRSKLLQFLASDDEHRSLLSDQQLRRLRLWMDTYGQPQGAFTRRAGSGTAGSASAVSIPV